MGSAPGLRAAPRYQLMGLAPMLRGPGSPTCYSLVGLCRGPDTNPGDRVAVSATSQGLVSLSRLSCHCGRMSCHSWLCVLTLPAGTTETPSSQPLHHSGPGLCHPCPDRWHTLRQEPGSKGNLGATREDGWGQMPHSEARWGLGLGGAGTAMGARWGVGGAQASVAGAKDAGQNRGVVVRQMGPRAGPEPPSCRPQEADSLFPSTPSGQPVPT